MCAGSECAHAACERCGAAQGRADAPGTCDSEGAYAAWCAAVQQCAVAAEAQCRSADHALCRIRPCVRCPQLCQVQSFPVRRKHWQCWVGKGGSKQFQCRHPRGVLGASWTRLQSSKVAGLFFTDQGWMPLNARVGILESETNTCWS